MAFTEEEEQGLRSLLEIYRMQAPALSEELATVGYGLFPEWDGNAHTYVEGEKFLYNGVLYKLIYPCSYTTQPDHTPDKAPSVYAKVLPGQEGTEIGEWVQPDSTNGYKKGDRVWHNGRLWESTFDGANVWEPGIVGVGENIWKDITEEA